MAGISYAYHIMHIITSDVYKDELTPVANRLTGSRWHAYIGSVYDNCSGSVRSIGGQLLQPAAVQHGASSAIYTGDHGQRFIVLVAG